VKASAQLKGYRETIGRDTKNAMETKIWRTVVSVFTFQQRYFISDNRSMITAVAAVPAVLPGSCLLLSYRRLVCGNVQGIETSLKTWRAEFQ
jgi:hypothetical protein